MQSSTDTYEFGDTVHYVDLSGARRAVIVDTTFRREDGRGRSGFEGVLIHTTNPADVRDGPERVWGYDDQITIVERKQT